MAQIAILAGLEIGLAIGQALLTPRGAKQKPVDKGKVDDQRFTIVEEGAKWGRYHGLRCRAGGNLIWGTPTQEHKTTTSGTAGGKKGRGAEPATNNFSYDKSFAAFIGEGTIKSFTRIWEGDDIIFNMSPGDSQQSNFYEAESSANVLAGGAAIVSDAACSGGQGVSVPPGGSVSFPNLFKNITETTAVVIYYKCSAAVSVTIRHNGVNDPTTAPNSSGAVIPTIALNYTLDAGSSNEIKITNTDGSDTILIDRLFCFPGFVAADPGEQTRTTGVIHPTLDYPADPDDPSAFYNYAPFPDGTGTSTVTLASGGQAQLEFYLGTADQPASPTIIAVEGAEHTPAFRNLFGVVFNHYTMKGGQLGNLTFEFEPLLSDLADILEYEYGLRGATTDEMDFSDLEGTIVDGLYIDALVPLSDIVEALEIFYGFKMVPVDGKIKAVLLANNTASIRTIPENEALAYEEGGERPRGIKIQHIEISDLPGGIYVAYVSGDETKDFHNATQWVPFGVGPALEAETINFPLVSNADTAVQVGKRYLFQQHTQAHPAEFSLDPKHRDLIPTDVVTLVTAQETVDVRLTSLQAMLLGLVKARAVPERAGLYNQVGSGQIGTGTEGRPVKIPANTLLALMDVPALRPEDDGQLRLYGAACGRGVGHWEGAWAFRELVAASDEYERLLGFAHSATIGVLVSNLPAIDQADLGDWDETNSIVLDLYFDEDLFESRPEADVLSRDVNTLIVGSGPYANVVKFANATYSATSFPYVRRVTLTGLRHAQKNTADGAMHGTAAGAVCVLLTDAVQSFPDDETTLDEPRNFIGVSVGQGLPDALTLGTQAFTSTGQSVRGPLPSNFDCIFDNGSGDALFEWDGTAAKGSSGQESYNLDLSIPGSGSFDDVRSQFIRSNRLQQSAIWSQVPASEGRIGTNMVGNVIDGGGVKMKIQNLGDGANASVDLEVGIFASLTGDNLIEFQIPNDRILVDLITLCPVTESFDDAHALYWNRGEIDTLPLPLSGYEITPSDGAGTPNDVIYKAVPGDRLGIFIREDGLPEFHLNYLGHTSRPLWTSPIPVLRDVKYHLIVRAGKPLGVTLAAWAGVLMGIHQTNIVRPNPEWRYIADAQKADNSGSLPSTIKARIRQRSFYAGGPPSAWVYGTFTRP